MRTDHDLDLVRRADPLAGATPPEPPAALAERILLSRQRPLPRRRTALQVVSATAVAGMVAVAIVAAGALAPDEGPGRFGGQPAAASVLEEAARVAAVQPGPDRLGRGQYWYQRSTEAWIGATAVPRTGDPDPDGDGSPGDQVAYAVRLPQIRESWTAADGSGRIRWGRQAGEPIFLSAKDRTRWEADGRPRLIAHHPGDEFISGEDRFDLRQLPLDPAELYTFINLRANPPTNTAVRPDPNRTVPDSPLARGNTFEYLTGFLGESQASPALRAALYQAAALIPGVEQARDVTDPAGRIGASVAVTDEQGIRNELIFDPATAAPLAWRLTTTRPVQGLDAAPGTVTGEVIYLARGVVDSTSARPDGH